MAKSGRPDKENMITGMFSKIARDAERQKKKEIREAKRRGEFYIIEHMELLPLKEQIKYLKDLKAFEDGGDQWNIEYKNKGSNKYPYPYHFMMVKDK